HRPVIGQCFTHRLADVLRLFDADGLDSRARRDIRKADFIVVCFKLWHTFYQHLKQTTMKSALRISRRARESSPSSWSVSNSGIPSTSISSFTMPNDELLKTNVFTGRS